MKKVCILVDQPRGEQLRKLLVEQGLLDTNFPITKKRNQLCFPIHREISISELTVLEHKVGHIKMVKKDLKPVLKKPANLSTALQDILPDKLHQLLPHSMDIIGEIAVVELNDLLRSYDTQIGQAIMMVNSRISTVYAKEGGVEGECRLRPLRLIAGKDQSTTIHTEFGVKIAVNVTQTYFSPRLGTEHDRIARLIQSGEVIVDMFTGVGPFALLAAKRQQVKVFAIDVNPQAIKCLQKSLELNRLIGEVIPLVGDARTIIGDQLAGKADRVIMNLPNDAFSFLDVASKAMKPNGGVIHFYGVTTEALSLETLANEVLDKLAEYGFDAKITISRVVRPAAPHEEQVVLDLHLTPV